MYICCIDMTHKEILTAFRNGNTEIIVICHITREENVCTILRAGQKQIHIAHSPYYIEKYENRGDVNYNYGMLKMVIKGA